MSPVGQPRESPRPKPIGNMFLMTLVSICALCALYFLWRETYSLRRVVSHQLKTLTRSEGRIRLSEDDGPSASEFLEDDFDEDNEVLRHDGLAMGLGSTNDVRTPHAPGASGG